MLQTSNLVRKQKRICGFKKQTFQQQDPLNFADVSIFLQNISIFYKKQYLYSKHQYESCVRDSLVLFLVFVRQKITVNENVCFTNYTSGLRLCNCFKLVINPINDNDVTNSNMMLSSGFYDLAVFLLVTGPSFTSISLLVLELWQFSSVKG